MTFPFSRGLRLEKQKTAGLVVGIIGITIVLYFVAGFISIWALNTLFELNIPYKFTTGLAAMILLGVFQNRSSSTKD
jgi:hypothetical protein